MPGLLLELLLLLGASFGMSWAVTWAMIRVAPRIGFVDTPGGRKIHSNPKPLGGGVGIVAGLVVPLAAAYCVFVLVPHPPDSEMFHLAAGARQQGPLLGTFALAILALHALGLADDRRPIGPYLKLVVQLAVAAVLVVAFREIRAVSFLDQYVGGPWLSISITILWIVAITNAFNFLDNMDGLSGGVAAVCTVAFLVAALSIGQLFVAATLVGLLGAIAGFLWFNFPPARIFMGDAGSLVVGFVLGVLTVRTTFLPPGESLGAGWYVVFAPVIVLAVPLYDLIVVSALRIARGRSPFVGDRNHFSHRLVARGMSRRTAVLCIYLISATTAIAAVVLPAVRSTLGAVLLFAQTLLILGTVLLLEQHPLPRSPRDDNDGGDP